MSDPIRIERRTVALSNISYRAKGEHTASFTGYASVFDTPTQIRDWLGSYSEQIKTGAFKRAIAEGQDVPLLFNHDGMPVANFPGSMTLSEDDRGLKVEADLDRRSSLANDLCVALERRDLKHMSFSFQATDEAWNDAYTSREVRDCDLFDVSVVTYPAYKSTSAGVRTEDDLAQVRTHALIAAQRSGKVLSGSNLALVKKAKKALSKATTHLDALHAAGTNANDQAPNADGTGANQGSPAGDNPINPADGAGPRSVNVLGIHRTLSKMSESKIQELIRTIRDARLAPSSVTSRDDFMRISDPFMAALNELSAFDLYRSGWRDDLRRTLAETRHACLPKSVRQAGDELAEIKGTLPLGNVKVVGDHVVRAVQLEELPEWRAALLRQINAQRHAAERRRRPRR